MTISTTTRLFVFQGNGATTVFPYDFLVPSSDDFSVQLQDHTTGALIDVLVPGDYILTGVGNPAGGTVTYNPVGGPIGSTVDIVGIRTMDYVQETAISNQGGFYPEAIEQQLDFIVMQVQQLAEQQSRSLIVNPGQVPPDLQEIADAVFDAQTAAAASAASASASSTSAGNSLTSANNSAASAVLAGQYANNPEDTPIPGHPGEFSALHFRNKCQAIFDQISNTLAGWIHAATAKASPTGADELGIADSGSSFTLKKLTLAVLATWLYPQMGPEYVIGMTISTNTGTPNTQMDVSAGEHRKGNLFGTAVAMTKRIDQVWAAGTGGGWRDSATAVAVSTDYHIHSIRNNSTGALDTISSLSATAPTVPGGYTLVGRIGSVRTNSAGNLIQRNQIGNKVVYLNNITWFTGTGNIASALVTAVDAPTTISTDLLISASAFSNAAGGNGTLSIWDAAGGSANIGCGMKIQTRSALASEVDSCFASSTPVRSNSSGQVYRNANLVTAFSYTAFIDGYIDYQIPRLGA